MKLQCYSSYKTEQAAKDVANHLWSSFSMNSRVEYCKDCSGWHVVTAGEAAFDRACRKMRFLRDPRLTTAEALKRCAEIDREAANAA